MNNEVKKVFTPKPVISFRSGRKMGSYLVRAKLYPEERTKGSFKCGSKRCEVCLNVTETSTFASTVTGETCIINHKFNCNGKCLVYLLTCNCCKKQYMGQTVDEFRFRWNNYKSITIIIINNFFFVGIIIQRFKILQIVFRPKKLIKAHYKPSKMNVLKDTSQQSFKLYIYWWELKKKKKAHKRTHICMYT